MSYFRYIRQDVVADPNNSSEENLTGNSTFVGAASSTLGVAGLQVSLKTDKNCTVYVEQSPDSTSWDIVDILNYEYLLGGNGWTVQAINSYVRVRVTNLSSSPTSYFRLQTALCPIVEAVPRCLNKDGNLKVASNIIDTLEFYGKNTPAGETRVATTTKLAGSSFRGDIVDPAFTVISVANDGTVTQGENQLLLETNTTPNGSAIYYSYRIARYSSGSANRFRAVIQLNNSGSVDNIRRWGVVYGSSMPTYTDGAYFELVGDALSLVIMKGSVETRINDGSFNGSYGAYFPLDANVKTFEIYWTNSKVWFVSADRVIHMFSASSEPWANTNSFHAYAATINTSGKNTNQTLAIRAISIARLGSLSNQPTSKFITGTTAGTVCKYSSGNLVSIVISNIKQSSDVILYDNIVASGTIIWQSGPMSNSDNPYSIDFKNIPFSNGLTLVVSTASSNILVIFE